MKTFRIVQKDGKERRYRTLGLAMLGFKEGDQAIYEDEYEYPKDRHLTDFHKQKRKGERLIYAG